MNTSFSQDLWGPAKTPPAIKYPKPPHPTPTQKTQPPFRQVTPLTFHPTQTTPLNKQMQQTQTVRSKPYGKTPRNNYIKNTVKI